MASRRAQHRHVIFEPSPQIVNLRDPAHEIALGGEDLFQRGCEHGHGTSGWLHTVKKTLHESPLLGRLVSCQNQATGRNQKILERAHGATVRQPADFLHNGTDRVPVISGFAFFDENTVLKNAAGVEKKGNPMSRSDGFHLTKIGQRHRMAATTVNAQLDINATQLFGALLFDYGAKLFYIDITLERRIRG